MADDVATPSNPPVAQIEQEEFEATSFDVIISQRPHEEELPRRVVCTRVDCSSVSSHTLSEDLGPLHRLQRCGGVDRQCDLEVFCHLTKVVLKASEMARHIGLVQCGYSTQAWEG
jgi:hypothetical protein